MLHWGICCSILSVKMRSLVVLSCVFGLSLATVYFQETFCDSWEDRWVASTNKGSDAGKFVHSAGEFYNDAEADKGIKTSQDAKFYGLSASFDKFSNEGKSLYIQFTVKHEQNIDCGGGYVKLFPSGLDQTDMSGDSPYNIMFGPDICGPGTKKVHVIFSYKGQNHLIKKDIRCKDDQMTHLYTLVVNADQTYEVRIDDSKVESGSFEEDWDFLPAKEIKDPEASKPDDWDEREKIDDPEDAKPEDWDTPEHISDPDATKPEDWDDDMDGEWEPPMIDNPEFKGEWRPKQIDNPDYKGKWVHPMIPNPEYSADDKIYAYEDFGVIGFDLWQVKSGTIFDSVIIADDEAPVKEMAESFKKQAKGEKTMKDEQDQKKREQEEEERKAREAEEAANQPDEDDEDAEDDEMPDHEPVEDDADEGEAPEEHDHDEL